MPDRAKPLSRIHAEENHRWTQMNTDSEGRTPVLPRFAFGHFPVSGFSPWKSAVVSSPYLCSSVVVLNCYGLSGPARWRKLARLMDLAELTSHGLNLLGLLTY